MRGAREDKLSWPRDQYELLGLSEAQRDELLLGWFTELGEESPERSVELFTAEIKRKDLDDLARQPLMLVILAQLFVIERTGSLPGTRVEAYDEIVRQVFDAYRRQVAPKADEATSVSATDASARPVADIIAADATSALHARLADPDGLVSQLALALYRGEASDVVEWLAGQTADLRQQPALTRSGGP